MDKQTVKKKFVAFVCQNFLVDEGDIEMEESLVDQGIIDSFGLVEISSYIQNQYHYEVKTEEMNRNNFGSVLKIVDYIIKVTGEHHEE